MTKVQTSVTNREQQAFDNIPEAESDAPAIVNSDPLWDMERRWRKLSNKYDDIPASCFRQCADELRAELLRQGPELDRRLREQFDRAEKAEADLAATIHARDGLAQERDLLLVHVDHVMAEVRLPMRASRPFDETNVEKVRRLRERAEAAEQKCDALEQDRERWRQAAVAYLQRAEAAEVIARKQEQETLAENFAKVSPVWKVFEAQKESEK